MTDPRRPHGQLYPPILAMAGFAAAFGVATCCALPLMLASAGVGAAWLGGIAVIAAQWRTGLLAASLLLLISASAMLLRQQLLARRCGPGGACTPRWVYWLTLSGIVLGTILLWAGYNYV